MKKHLIYWLAAVSIMMVSCQKELSFEGSNSPAKGSLQSDITGDCLPKTVNGTYEALKPLVPATNTITVQVNVTKTGTYLVATDTINGYYFRGTGTFTTLGATNVTLRGNGTPAIGPHTDNFVVSFDTTFCDIQVTVLPAGAGGPAQFTLVSGGIPANCANAIVAGTYVKDMAVNASNYVDVSVNVTTIGTYTIKATGGGLTFQNTGAFLSTGPQTIRLQASGMPTTVGANTITFDPPFASCSFTVTVSGPAVYTIDCPNVVVNGTYQVGQSLNPVVHTIDIPVTVITAGAYSITASVNGMTFTGSGTLAVGPATITLTGSSSSAPAGPAGIKNLLVGTPACSIPITVAAAPIINWKFNIGATVYQGSSSTVPGDVDYDVTTFPPFSFFTYIGFNAALDECDFDLLDLTGGVTANEIYNSDAAPFTQASDFFFTDGGGTLDLEATFGSSGGAKMVFRVTSHNTSTKTIIGTFSGTAWDNLSSTLKTISSGTFTVVYP